VAPIPSRKEAKIPDLLSPLVQTTPNFGISAEKCVHMLLAVKGELLLRLWELRRRRNRRGKLITLRYMLGMTFDFTKAL